MEFPKIQRPHSSREKFMMLMGVLNTAKVKCKVRAAPELGERI